MKSDLFSFPFHLNHQLLPYFFIFFIIICLFSLIFIFNVSFALSLVILSSCIILLISINLQDKWILLAVFMSHFLYLDFLPKGHSLFKVVLPLAFFMLLFRRLNRNEIDIKFVFEKSWHFLLYFFVGFFWFTQTGLAPSIITGKDAFGLGNFALYFNILLSMTALLLPFISKLEISDFIHLIKICLVILILKALVLAVYVSTGRSFFIPLAVPYSKNMIEFSQLGYVRIGDISNISFFIILFSIFLEKKLNKFLKWPVVVFALSINIIWGGGRLDLISSVFILTFAHVFMVKKLNLAVILKSLFKFSAVVLVVLILFVTLTNFLAPKQKERFAEILNPRRAYEVRQGAVVSRMEMWKYAIQEGFQQPWIGHGISPYFDETTYFRRSNYFVEAGGAHNQYITIFYTLGLLGLLPFLLGSVLLFRKLMFFKRNHFFYLWGLFLLFFLEEYFVRFLLSGGFSTVNFIFYFFVGYVLSYRINVKNTLRIKF